MTINHHRLRGEVHIGSHTSGGVRFLFWDRLPSYANPPWHVLRAKADDTVGIKTQTGRFSSLFKKEGSKESLRLGFCFACLRKLYKKSLQKLQSAKF